MTGDKTSSSSLTLKHLFPFLYSCPFFALSTPHTHHLALSTHYTFHPHSLSLTHHPCTVHSSHSPPLTLSTPHTLHFSHLVHPSLTLSTHSHATHRLQAWYEKQKQVVIKTAVEREAFINFAFFYAEAFARVRLVKKTCFIQKTKYRVRLFY